MGGLIFILGLLSGAIIVSATILIVAVIIAFKTGKGDNQECTNQKQQ